MPLEPEPEVKPEVTCLRHFEAKRKRVFSSHIRQSKQSIRWTEGRTEGGAMARMVSDNFKNIQRYQKY